MKNARPQTTEASAVDKRDCTPGTLLKRTDTVIASALAGLLEIFTAGICLLVSKRRLWRVRRIGGGE